MVVRLNIRSRVALSGTGRLYALHCSVGRIYLASMLAVHVSWSRKWGVTTSVGLLKGRAVGKVQAAGCLGSMRTSARQGVQSNPKVLEQYTSDNRVRPY